MNGIVLLVDGVAKVYVGYDGWTTGSVCMHILIEDPKAMGRDILRAAFDYPFRQCDRQVVIGVVRSDNPDALDFDRRVGFLTSSIIPDAYGPGVDMHILYLPRHLSKKW
jgi:hypothetical protein